MSKNRLLLIPVLIGFLTLDADAHYRRLWRTKSVKPIPTRIDIQLLGGVSRQWSFSDEIFSYTGVFDFDARVLIEKSDIKHKIPRRFRRSLADQIYIGHALIPNAFAFSNNTELSAWDFYVDWNPLGMTLLRYPRQQTFSAPAHILINTNLAVGYHFLHYNNIDYHSIRPGVGIRADFALRMTKALSFKLTVFQKRFYSHIKTINGEEKNIMPNHGFIGTGVVLHFPRQIKM